MHHHRQLFDDKDPVTYKLLLINTLPHQIPQITSSLFSLQEKSKLPITHTYTKLIYYEGADIALNINELDLDAKHFGDADSKFYSRVYGIIFLYNSMESDKYNQGLQAYNLFKSHLANENLHNYAIEIKEPGHHGGSRNHSELGKLGFQLLESHNVKIDLFEKIGIDLFRKIELRSSSSPAKNQFVKRMGVCVVLLGLLFILLQRFMRNMEERKD